VESGGLLSMSGAARVLDGANPVFLNGAGLWITIGGGFDYTGNIAIVNTAGPYAPGTEILKHEGGISVAPYRDYFNVDAKGFGASIGPDGKLL
jgi:hypothetical protein